MGTCLKDFVRVPRVPLTVTVLALTEISTPSGISRSCSATMYFMINNISII